MKSHATVLATIGATDKLKLYVAQLRIVVDGGYVARVDSDLEFIWFRMSGNSTADARRNCIESIAFYLRSRPELRDPILAALDESSALDVAALIGGYVGQDTSQKTSS